MVLTNVVIGLITHLYLVNNEIKVIMIATFISGILNGIFNMRLVSFIELLYTQISAIITYKVVTLWRWYDLKITLVITFAMFVTVYMYHFAHVY